MFFLGIIYRADISEMRLGLPRVCVGWEELIDKGNEKKCNNGEKAGAQ